MLKIGIDLVENSRFEKIINEEKKYKRILSEEELKYFNKVENQKRKIEYLASRFAAKEAVIKAISKEKRSFSYSDISVLNDEDGAPYLVFNFDVDFEASISISHTDSNSIAFVIVSKKIK